MARAGVLHCLLVEAGRGVGDDVGVIGGVAEALVVGIAGMAGVDNRMRRPLAASTAPCRICHDTTVEPRNPPPVQDASVGRKR